ncbi:MAG: PRC-barrel domain-containing protein [Patescibacteria group bacterium]
MKTQNSNQLLKGKNIVGLKVLSLDTGEFLDDVDELIFDPKEHKVKAFVVDEGGWFSDAKIILFNDVKSIGKDAITIESKNLVKKASELKGSVVQRILNEDNYLTDNKVITEDGVELGQVSDIFFDKYNGEVGELEVSQGALKNIQSGKVRVSVSDIVNVGVEATIVKAYTKEEIEKQSKTQGIQGIASEAAQKTSEAANKSLEKMSDFASKTKSKTESTLKNPENRDKMESAKAKTQEVDKSIGEKIDEAVDDVSSYVQNEKEKYSKDQKRNAIGKYLTINILSKKDEVIAHRGDLVTHDLVEKVNNEGVLDLLLGNVAQKPIEDGVSTAGTRYRV